MNCVNIIGRLTADPEVRYTTGDKPMAIGRFTLAVDKKYTKEGEANADFIRCIAFGKLGEFSEKHLKKGYKMGITGRIQTGSYNDKDTGKTVYTFEVVCESFTFCEGKKETTQSSDPIGWQSIADLPDSELPFN